MYCTVRMGKREARERVPCRLSRVCSRWCRCRSRRHTASQSTHKLLGRVCPCVHLSAPSPAFVAKDLLFFTVFSGSAVLRGMGWGSERSGLPRFGIVPAIPPADARRLVAAELGAVVQLKGSAWWGVAEGRALPDD